MILHLFIKLFIKQIIFIKIVNLEKTGEPYITHPIAVSSILVKYGLDAETCAAALLHDTVEDTSYTFKKDCEKEFGTVIATLVDGVTKVDMMLIMKLMRRLLEVLLKMLGHLQLKVEIDFII